MLGFDHILDWNGYDHILFITVLCALYSPVQWKKILILVTAFTVGHSITLALSSLDIVTFQSQIIEICIPVTIVLTAIFNILTALKDKEATKGIMVNYLLAGGFGLIHGLGFSNYFKAILGREESIVQPLLAFNIGVEIGQIVIVVLILLLSYVVLKILKIPIKYWTVIVSLIGIIVSMQMIIDKI